MLDYPGIWNNEYLIYLSVPRLADLGRWEERIAEAGLNYSAFCEPDLGNEVTAIAVVSDGKLFRKLPLLGG